MSSIQIERRDFNGQIIEKNNKKNYHIFFNDQIDIINVRSYKIYNKIRDGESFDDDDFFVDEENINGKKGNFIDSYQKTEYDNCPNRDPKSFSRGGCYIF